MFLQTTKQISLNYINSKNTPSLKIEDQSVPEKKAITAVPRGLAILRLKFVTYRRGPQ